MLLYILFNGSNPFSGPGFKKPQRKNTLIHLLTCEDIMEFIESGNVSNHNIIISHVNRDLRLTWSVQNQLLH